MTTTVSRSTESATSRYDALLDRLDLEAKVALLTGAAVFTMAGNVDIGLAPMNLSDGPTGVRGLKFSGGREVTLFPNATLLSASWSTETAREVGRLLAEEAMVQDVSVVLGPTINLHRSVLGGRLFEAYSEDPLLTGRLAAAYVEGLQASGVGACLKHLVANESETDRNSVDSVVDEATLRELYLLPFEIAIAESDPWSLMAAYNDVNGQAATEQVHVNNEIVKGEWGYDGLIMSDWFATKTTAASANGGLDLVMPGPHGPWGEALVAAVRAGEVAESVIDDHVVRVLRLADRVGKLGEPRALPTDLPTPDSPVRREQLTRLAAAGMTVLTNDGTLPFAAGPEAPSVALIGRLGLQTTLMGGGSAQVNPPYQVSIAEGLGAVLGDRLTVTDGVEVRSRPTPAGADVLRHPETGEPGVQVEVLAADGRVLDVRAASSASGMVGFDDDYDVPATGVRFIARSALGGEVELGGTGAGVWTLAAGDQQHAFTLTSAGGIGAVMLAPPAELRRTMLHEGDLIEATVRLETADGDNPLAGVGLFSLVLRPVPTPLEQVLGRAAAAARAADVAVVVVGLTEEQETEAVDKATIALPGDQDALVHAVAAAAREAGRRSVVLVNAATPVLMPWRDEVDAIVWIGLPGQEGGHAVAAALTGAIEPAGRLVTTFPAADGAAPAWEVVPTDGALAYAEGTAIGYRGHFSGTVDGPVAAPAFWLGHGLGYADWSYDAVAGDTSAVRVRVTNTGSRDSREVVQVYYAPAEPGQPVRLVGWTAVEVAAGASAEVEVVPDARLWRRWDTAADAWGEPLTDGELLVARGLGDVRARLAV
ncbi:beta-glucosidase [Friedmanniella endophytica]|uniref:Beta-glucosidase n=1 Tax=Microlunatus kandeliicorticis TaxID=1759536 RepID=A0A7W3IVF6_9ACTN|nr:glycoside hydrolase family 3 C-terminal domain-containing protein [Microlunatus kandeliicorticis]MBA8796013.1 beta-glucosidase [Microlunatus kandeliicorticis]